MCPLRRTTRCSGARPCLPGDNPTRARADPPSTFSHPPPPCSRPPSPSRAPSPLTRPSRSGRTTCPWTGRPWCAHRARGRPTRTRSTSPSPRVAGCGCPGRRAMGAWAAATGHHRGLRLSSSLGRARRAWAGPPGARPKPTPKPSRAASPTPRPACTTSTYPRRTWRPAARRAPPPAPCSTESATLGPAARGRPSGPLRRRPGPASGRTPSAWPSWATWARRTTRPPRWTT